MRVFHVKVAEAEYDIHFGPGLLSRLGGLLRAIGLTGKVALITNPTVAALHAPIAIASLHSEGYYVQTIDMPDGEAEKNLRTVAGLYDACFAAGLERGDVVVALGGGVVGDTAGFVAATYLRGLPFVQVPTTLLAQVDASIGGKVAVDHAHAKNIIGAFYQPRLVVSDPQVLETLPPEEFRCGLAEIVKAGLIRAPRLFAQLEEGGAEPLAAIVAEAIAVKVDVVVADPYERDLRVILNFGHTVGHGIEAASQYRLRHGDAVSVGMIAATKMAIALELCPVEVEQRLSNLLRRFDLPITMPGIAPDTIWQAMWADKKRQQGRLRFVLPRAIGDVVVTDSVPEEIVRRAIAAVAGSDN